MSQAKIGKPDFYPMTQKIEEVSIFFPTTIYVKSLRTTVSLNSSTFQCDKYLYYGRFGNYSQLSLIWDQARSCSFSRLKMTLIQRQLVIFENDQKNGLGFYLKNMALTDPSLLVYCS